MSGSAVLFGALGGATLFFPLELASVTGLGSTAELPVQLLAGGLLSFAALNWMGRGAIYGGIYGRPIVVANFGFGMITAGTMMSAVLDERIGSSAWILVAVFGLHAVGFFMMMRAPPWPRTTSGGEGESGGGSA